MDLDTFSDIDEKTAFQLGFLSFCKEAGLTEEQAAEFVAHAVKVASEPTWGQFGQGLVDTVTGNVPKGTGWGSYMDKWYNPWTTNTDPLTAGEGTLRAIGRAGMGIGAGSAALAGGIAAAPAAAAAMPTSLAGSLTPLALIGGLTSLGNTGINAVKSTAGAVLDAGKENLKNNAGTYSMLALGALPALGLVAGGALGHGAAKFQEPNVSDDDIKAKELADTYKTYTDRLKARRMYQQYRQARQTGGA